MDYETFKTEYTKAFYSCMKYKPSEVGSSLYADKMADLADAYPEFLEKLESEE